MDAQQYSLDFTSRSQELIALTSGLTRQPLFVGESVLSMGRVYGVIDLLKRLILIARDTRHDQIVVTAQVPYIAAAMHGFRVVSERTVQRWSSDAQSLGLLDVDVRARKFGNRNWNEWTIRIDELRKRSTQQVVRHGPTWCDTVSGLGCDTVSGLGCDKMSGLQIRELNSERINLPGRPGAPARPGIDFLPDWPELLPIRDAIVDPISDEQLARLTPDRRATLAGHRAFEPITEYWLKHDGDVSFWHRWQLRLADPVVGATQAHAALVLAAARHAVAFPKARLLKNRVALFVGIVSKRSWEPVRCRLGAVLAEMCVGQLTT